MAQDSVDIDRLSFYCDVMINADGANHREEAHNIFFDGLIANLREDTFSDEDYSTLRWISVLHDSLSDARIFTWQIMDADGRFSSYGVVKTSEKVYQLLDRSDQLTDMKYMSLSGDEWPGVIYYNMMPTEVDGERALLLFGFDRLDEFTNRKLVDVMKIGEDGITFGSEIFSKSSTGSRNDMQSRLILDYSSDAAVTLNYKPGLDLIVHDHLIARIGTRPGQGATQLPDGSLEGWKFENGKWNYVEKIFDQVSEKAPRTKPVIGNDRGIFGKK